MENIKGYTAIKEIGAGNFGKVFEAVNQKGQHFAIKKIFLRTANKKLLSLIENEVKTLRIVDNPAILRLYESFQVESHIYIVTELCSGGDLEHHMRSHGRISPNVVKRWLKQLILALSDLRRQNIVHRDLKIANLLLTDPNIEVADLKICDFGFAKFLGDSLTSTQLGTPMYMAPEIFTSDSYNFKVDIWSLGILTYEMLCGCPPFNCYKLEELKRLQKEPIKFKADIELPETVKSIICDMLTYNPVNRPDYDALLQHEFFFEREQIRSEVIEEEYFVLGKEDLEEDDQKKAEDDQKKVEDDQNKEDAEVKDPEVSEYTIHSEKARLDEEKKNESDENELEKQEIQLDNQKRVLASEDISGSLRQTEEEKELEILLESNEKIIEKKVETKLILDSGSYSANSDPVDYQEKNKQNIPVIISKFEPPIIEKVSSYPDLDNVFIENKSTGQNSYPRLEHPVPVIQICPSRYDPNSLQHNINKMRLQIDREMKSVEEALSLTSEYCKVYEILYCIYSFAKDKYKNLYNQIIELSQKYQNNQEIADDFNDSSQQIQERYFEFECKFEEINKKFAKLTENSKNEAIQQILIDEAYEKISDSINSSKRKAILLLNIGYLLYPENAIILDALIDLN